MILRGTNKMKQLIIVTLVRKKSKIYLDEYKLSRKKRKRNTEICTPFANRFHAIPNFLANLK